MLGAIYVGLSGLNAYSGGLKTISNNVANLNTAGFKSTTVSFVDLFSKGGGLNGAPGGDGVGEGVGIAASRTDFTDGDLRASDGDLDLAIKGSGFLVLLDGDDTFYTRTGQFGVDDNGFIAQQNSSNRLGILDSGGRAVALNVDDKRTNAPVATTTITFADNLSSTATAEVTVSGIAVYDSNGGKQVWAATFTKSTAPGDTNVWDVVVKDQDGETVGTSKLRFIGNIVDPATATLVVTDNPPNADPLSVTLDFSTGVTSFSAGTTSSLRAAKVDGHAVGALTTVGVDAAGKIKLTYSNGETATLGSVAIADFRDPQGLTRAAGGLYEYSGIGERRLLASGVDGVGQIVGKQTEASNVDLSAAFGDLILIQRGYQASSQVVSVANDMIQQLFGIRGQG